jgi:hypothetical protein
VAPNLELKDAVGKGDFEVLMILDILVKTGSQELFKVGNDITHRELELVDTHVFKKRLAGGISQQTIINKLSHSLLEALVFIV